jgi:rare lipoprotein A
VRVRPYYATLIAALIISAAPGILKAKKNKAYTEEGTASWYGRKFHGKKTASGEKYDMNKLTAAHRTLPFGTKVKVTRLDNNKSVVVRINDRGPFVEGRIIDLSRAAAKKLDMLESGTASVRIKVVKPAPGIKKN